MSSVDIDSNIFVTNSLSQSSFINFTNPADGTIDGTSFIDTFDYESVTFVMTYLGFEPSTPLSGVMGIKMLDSDDGLSFDEVSDEHYTNSNVDSSIDFKLVSSEPAPNIFGIVTRGYIGNKRYIRHSISFNGLSLEPSVSISIYAVLSSKRSKPVPNNHVVNPH